MVTGHDSLTLFVRVMVCHPRYYIFLLLLVVLFVFVEDLLHVYGEEAMVSG